MTNRITERTSEWHNRWW